MADGAQVFAISDLTLNGHPVSSCMVTYQVGAVPVCTVVPVLGTAPDGSTEGAQWIADLQNGTEAELVLSFAGTNLLLFKGRISGQQVDASAGAYGAMGRSTSTINITHMLGDLESFSFGQREFYIGGYRDRFIPPTTAGRTDALTLSAMMHTPALEALKPAVHIRDIMSMLVEWYQGNTSGMTVNVAELLKASSVKMRSFNEEISIIKALKDTTADAIRSGVGSGATPLALTKVLADFCMLTLMPRLTDGAIVPNLPVIKQSGGTPFSDKNVTAIWRGTRLPVLPTTRVCVHHIPPADFKSESASVFIGEYKVNVERNTTLIGSTYPPVANGQRVDNILVSMPPPILKDVLHKVLIGDTTTVMPPRSVENTCRADMPAASERSQKDRTGQVPQAQGRAESEVVGEAAARAIYCTRAYSECSASIFLAPGYVFSGGLRRDTAALNQGWEDDSLWGFLGKVVRFQSPYSEQGRLAKQDLVGYVNTMTIEINRAAPSASVQVGLGYVRPVAKDREHSIDVSNHPLFVSLTGLKVE